MLLLSVITTEKTLIKRIFPVAWQSQDQFEVMEWLPDLLQDF